MTKNDSITPGSPGASSTESGVTELEQSVTLVDIAARLHLQVAIALQAAELTDAGRNWRWVHHRRMSGLNNVLKVADDKREIGNVLRICSDALQNKDDQFARLANLDMDKLHLALDCLVDHIDSNSHGIYENQPWRFFLARIGVLARQSTLSKSSQTAKLDRIERVTETLPEYIRYLYGEIDAEHAKTTPDISRIIAMEQEADRLQNLQGHTFRPWRGF